MGRLLTISDYYSNRNRATKRTIKPELKIGPVSLSFISIIIMCILALFYLYQINQSAVKGYDIKNLEDKKSEIITEMEKLRIEAASLRSIKNIENNPEINNMVPTKKINYWPNSSFAVK